MSCTASSRRSPRTCSSVRAATPGSRRSGPAGRQRLGRDRARPRAAVGEEGHRQGGRGGDQARRQAGVSKAAEATKKVEEAEAAEGTDTEPQDTETTTPQDSRTPYIDGPEAPGGEPDDATDGGYGPGSAAPNEDGSAPAGFEIKGNADSMKYHEPDGQWYDQTGAEVYFATAADAEGRLHQGRRTIGARFEHPGTLTSRGARLSSAQTSVDVVQDHLSRDGPFPSTEPRAPTHTRRRYRDGGAIPRMPATPSTASATAVLLESFGRTPELVATALDGMSDADLTRRSRRQHPRVAGLRTDAG